MKSVEKGVLLTAQEYAELTRGAEKCAKRLEKPKREKLCCSKKILVASYTITILMTLTALLGAFLTDRDMTPVATIAGLAWAETGACTGFYYWKAKNENRIKLTLGMVKELADKYGIDAVAQLAGITLKD